MEGAHTINNYVYEPIHSTTSNAAGDYKYRLFHLFPGTCSSPLEGSLQISDAFPTLSESSTTQTHQPYEAISYVWGDIALEEDVICDGKRLQITSSLATALRRFRLADRTRVLWADGICINQDDISERGHQVQLMAALYSQASQVLCWLGDDEGHHAEYIFKLGQTLSHKADLHNGQQQPGVAGTGVDGFDPEKDDEFWDKLEELDYLLQDPSVQEHIHQVFRKPWFSRMWVRQEIGWADEATVFCGQWQTDWPSLWMVGYWALRAASRINVQIEIPVKHPPLNFTFQAQTPFLHLLIKSRDFQCLDARDKVFALLAHPQAYQDPVREAELNRTEPTHQPIFDGQDDGIPLNIEVIGQEVQAAIIASLEDLKTFMNDPFCYVCQALYLAPTRLPLGYGGRLAWIAKANGSKETLIQLRESLRRFELTSDANEVANRLWMEALDYAIGRHIPLEELSRRGTKLKKKMTDLIRAITQRSGRQETKGFGKSTNPLASRDVAGRLAQAVHAAVRQVLYLKYTSPDILVNRSYRDFGMDIVEEAHLAGITLSEHLKIRSTSGNQDYDNTKSAVLLHTYILLKMIHTFERKKRLDVCRIILDKRNDLRSRLDAMQQLDWIPGERIMEADYTKTTEDVYHEIAIAVIHRSGNLDILCAVDHQVHNEVNLLPSWVPRWDRHQMHRRIGFGSSLKTSYGAWDEPESVGIRRRWAVDGLVIKTAAVVVDTISFVTNPVTECTLNPVEWTHRLPNMQELEELRFWRDIASRNLAMTEAAPLTDMQRLQIYKQVLTAGDAKASATVEFASWKRDSVQGPEQSWHNFAAFWADLNTAEAMLISKEEPVFASKQIFPLPPEAQDAASRGKSLEFMNQAKRDSVCHRVFFTGSSDNLKGNTYTGLGPNTTQVGDLVCLLPDTRVPFVLRPLSSNKVSETRRFHLVGECYVDGIMHGEAMDASSKIVHIEIH